MASVGVIGSGVWGTTLALLLARKGIATVLWEHHPERALEMQRSAKMHSFSLAFFSQRDLLLRLISRRPHGTKIC